MKKKENKTKQLKLKKITVAKLNQFNMNRIRGGNEEDRPTIVPPASKRDDC